MKYKFKDSNYIINIKKNSSLSQRIEKSKNDEAEVARLVINEFDRKSEKLEMFKLKCFHLAGWGLILTLSKQFGGFFQSELYQNAVPFFIGFTALFSSLGIYSQIASSYYNKKYEEMIQVRKEIIEKSKQNK